MARRWFIRWRHLDGVVVHKVAAGAHGGMDSPTLIGCVDGGGDRATGLILDCLWRLFGHEEVEAGLADLEDGTPAALRRWALELARAEELQSIWRHAAERKEPPKSSRDLWAVASAVVAHMRQALRSFFGRNLGA
ncbi:hypothetical protein AK812_SmicGene39590 [Symbiodinium microadriaticum]|uniref:Uncharacterized protein n=1 Tax=Symbiodinium microadriaticum TaxID=2951 RepID=A0A1Q9CAV2_SYMMI|nr:hypothetical protein AK812_SmicGene39590 [Symbiodinium microadriaticum]